MPEIDTDKERKCTTCSVVQEIEEFSFRNKAEGIRRHKCKTCQRAYSKKHYENDKQYYLNKNKKNTPAWVNKRKKKLEEVKISLGGKCPKCGEDDLSLLEFHHLDPEVKVDTVAGLMAGGKSWEIIQEEINKCQLLCGNCHRIVTHTERKTWRTRPIPTDKDIEALRKEMNTIPFTDQEEARQKVLAKFENCEDCESEEYDDQCRLCRDKFHKYVHQARLGNRLALRNKIGSLRSKKIVGKVLTENNCQDCGYGNWLAFEFDHLRDKTKNIAYFTSYYTSEKVLLEEIEKCEIVCRNCHRKRTSKRLEANPEDPLD